MTEKTGEDGESNQKYPPSGLAQHATHPTFSPRETAVNAKLNENQEDHEKRVPDPLSTPSEPPSATKPTVSQQDGGAYAWTQVFLGHLALFNTWGYINSFGVFQEHYTRTLHRAPSDISWVGSLQISLLFLVGTVGGRAMDAGYFKAVFMTGSFLQVLSVFMTSICKTYWQILLAQGLCNGLGNGLVFCPSFALLGRIFSKNRALAIGVAATGSATGGVVIPIIAQRLLPRIGFGWTMRVIGFVMLSTMCLTVPFFNSRQPPRRTGPLVEWAAFREPPYLLFAISVFFTFWGLYFAFYYVGMFSRDILGASQSTSITILAIMNGLGLPGRIIPGFVADRYLGSLNMFIPFVFASAILLYCWAAVDSLGGVYPFAVIYGFFAAGIQSLFLASLSSLTTDLTKMGTRMGMVLSILSIVTLTGSPLAGALIQRKDGDYLYAQMFAGSSMAVGLLTLLMARVAKTGYHVRIKV
ncbi:hypothetical protein M409DRAFT_69788 [Zasmidium cellare ATCC 36951]|uniref:Major facilitator superfamily (MFS) profile domain-containing protein n=1 Tax=Zasmidium cellare ATCC 36951 TaxID=1080233 RepID=A0A6A6C3F5_ZASCE|nr:uncharacterized protein M409DRAFT_69788 [Zasmidium cellare ATCC 36951]KAF2161443.1 hypothetical protein M409DRAFT_69788 [Zasmidium cellare ATCC 36951]